MGRHDTRAVSIAEDYDRVAVAYAAAFADELDHKPLDRALLELIADEARGLIADLGAGPGHAAAYLAARGARVIAIDLSPAMVAQAEARGLDARIGDLCALPLPDASLGAAVALYAIVHLSAEQLRGFAVELARVLAPGAPALISFHVGADRVHVTELLATPVDLTFRFFELAEVAAALTAAGLVVEVRLERVPYVPHEYPSTRGYLVARR
jgi:SAM-dependent methyltransferase